MSSNTLVRTATVFALFMPALHASLVEFSSFLSYDGTSPIYTYTNNTSNSTGTLSANADVYFFFYPGNIPSYALKQSLPTGPVHATLARTSSSSSPVTCAAGTGTQCSSGTLSQPIGIGSIVFYAFGTSNILFEIDGAANNVTGSYGGTTGGFSASSGSTAFSFYSDYINFNDTDQLDRSITLSTIISPPGAQGAANTGLTVNADGLLNSFTAQASGNFSAEFVQTPEPDSAAFAWIGLALLGTRRRAGLALRKVIQARWKCVSLKEVGYFRP